MEPERKIEKLLRAFAKKRREQAGDALELHASARKQLQNEVSRHASKKSDAGLSLFSWFRPRLAFAVCFLAIVTVSAWLLLPALNGRKPESVASADIRGAKDLSREQVDTIAPAAPNYGAAPAGESGEKKVLSDNRREADGLALKTPEFKESRRDAATVAEQPVNAPAVPMENLAFGVNSDV